MNVTGNIECWSTAVAEGVKLLDDSRPGWWKEINLNVLDMYSTRYCVLGQLYHGSFCTGRIELGIGEGEGDLYGFDTYTGNWETLDYLWRDIISARRATQA